MTGYLDAMALAVSPGGGDLEGEAYLAYVTARKLAGDGWRDLYLAHWARAHPCPGPMEDGVLQVGDRVRFTGRQGGLQGPGTVTRIASHEYLPGHVAWQLEYELDEPFTDRDGSVKLGGVASSGTLVHARDWPATFLGDFRPDYELREGEGPRPEGWPAP